MNTSVDRLRLVGYRQELRAGARARRRRHGGEAGHRAWAPRRERCRQVDAAAHPVRRPRALVGARRDRRRSVVAGHGPVAARRAGIAMIHQELQHVPELTVAQNMFLGHPLKPPAAFSWRAAAGAGGGRGAGAARPDHRSGRTDPHPQGRPAPDRRDRPRHDGRRQGPRHGRADVEPDAGRVRAPRRPDRRAGGAGRLDHLCLAQDGRGVPRLRAPRRSCATGARSTMSS